MMNRSRLARRDFLKLAAVSGISSYFLSSCRQPQSAAIDDNTKADLILTNGNIATQDDRRSLAQAVAISNGRFLAVGTQKEVMAYKGDNTKIIDARGRTVIPGINDTHTHLIRGGLNYNMELRWDGVPSLADGLCLFRLDLVSSGQISYPFS